MVFTVDYLMTRMKQQLFTVKQGCHRYRKKKLEVKMHLMGRRNLGRIMTVAVVLVRLTAPLPSQH